VETVVRLIRSKGVGIYFVTQNPLDLPATVLGQLGNRVQHALRAFTPAEQKAVRAAAETFRPNPKLRVEEAITHLGVGEALVSTLQEDGTPSMVERARILPPRGRIGAITPEERAAVMQASPLAGRYDKAVDRDSAYERLQGRATAAPAAGPWRSGPAPTRDSNPWGGATSLPPLPTPPPARGSRIPQIPPRQQGGGGMGEILGDILTGRGGKREGVAESMAKSAARSIGSSVGRQISQAVLRGVLGSILKR
jgi:hypothetical protein